jgi:hypothetical protein
VVAHEGHGIPGALPPALHGGIVQEAEHQSKDVHSGKEEVELFFEAVYKNKEITVYPLTFPKDSTATFQLLSAKKDLSGVTLKVELPRAKKTELLKATVTEDGIKAPFDSKGANRFIVHVAAKHMQEEKAAKIQIENN